MVKWWNKLTLTKSSIISLSAETKRIKHNGTNVVNRPVGDTSGICCNKIKTKNDNFSYCVALWTKNYRTNSHLY